MSSKPFLADRWLPSVQARHLILLAAAIAAAALCFGSIRSQAKFGESPIACDDFGYYRQAQLFRERGPVGGLDTLIADPLTLALVAIAKSTGLPPSDWQEPVAPHCHHYKPATGKITLQYPPGTGLVLAPFPEGVRARWVLHGVSLALLAALLSALVMRPTLVTAAWIAWLSVVFFYDKSWLGPSWSTMPSLPLVVALGAIVATRFDPDAPDWRWHALAGLILGFSINLRIPNGFLLAGFLTFYAGAFLMRPSLLRFVAPLCFGITLIAGALPTLAANAINAGSPFASTYSAADSASPVLTWLSLMDGLRYYTVTFRKSGLFVLTAFVPVIALAISVWRRFDRQAASTLIIVAINLVTNLGYFLLHDPRAPYYPAPVAVFAASASVFALIRWQQGPVVTTMRRLIAPLAVIFVVVAIAATLRSRPVSSLFTDPQANPDFGKTTIVWGDFTASYVHYFKHRQASKLVSTSPEVQEKLVSAVRKAGYDQVLIAEPGNMTAAIEHLSRTLPLEKGDRVYGYDTYLIKAARPRPAAEPQK